VSRRLRPPADLGALSGSASVIARALVSLDSDIAVVVDDGGIVTSVAQDSQHPMAPAAADWVGRRWALTASGATRRKIELLLADTQGGGESRRREVNHALDSGHELPVSYTAQRLGPRGAVLALGRDLRRVVARQQRCLVGQQTLERHWWGTQHQRSSDRHLQRVASDALLVVQPRSLCILQANASAAWALQCEAPSLAGQPLLPRFEARARPAVAALLAAAVDGRHAVEIRARLAGSHHALSVAAARCDGGHRLLLRLRDQQPEMDAGALPAVVVTDIDGRIRQASPRFALWAGHAEPSSLLGQPLEDRLPLATPQVMGEVRSLGLLTRAGLLGGWRPVEVTACLAMDGEEAHCHFSLRPRTAATPR